MNNKLSIIMLGFALTVSIAFLLKGYRQPVPEKETQKRDAIFLSGAAIGFIAGIVLGVTNPDFFSARPFLVKKGLLSGQ
ncbi:MAG: hypothetical protein EPN22_08845 [Nitrospirae bacterium]|nr:MAG: hypothetical protein EPN22_08845 [Nitrospirota bacterium]